MRENALLSPHRARTRDDTPHDRHIITDAPNVMWATDATQIITVQDGKVWLFGVAEHWNAEALGWHVAKRGDRYAAVEAVGMAVRNVFGHVSPSAARGVALRHDHGSAFLAEHFHNQIRFWGMTPSYAFVGEPETTDEVDQSFLRDLVLFSGGPWVTAWQRAGREGKARPRRLQCRPSFAAPVGTFGPRRVQPSVCRR